MKPWHYLFYLLLTAIIFGIYIFNPSLAGADSYFYINQICEISPLVNVDAVFDFLLPFFACDFVFLKVYLAILFFSALIIFSKIGELYYKDDGWVLGLIAVFLTFFWTSFLVFENDSLGFVLAFLSLYFVLKAYKSGEKWYSKNNIIGIVLIVIAGLVWKGAAYWVLAMAVLSPIFIPVFLAIFLLYGDRLLWFTTATREVQEQLMFLGIIYLGFTPLFLFSLPKMSKKEILILIIFTLPVIFVQKLYVLAVPFYAILALHGILSLKKYKDTLIITLIVFSLFSSVLIGMISFNQFPTPGDMDIIKMATGDTNYVENSFGIGYIAIYNGLAVSSYGGTDGNDYVCSGYVLEHPWGADCNNSCTELAKSTNILYQKC